MILYNSSNFQKAHALLFYSIIFLSAIKLIVCNGRLCTLPREIQKEILKKTVPSINHNPHILINLFKNRHVNKTWLNIINEIFAERAEQQHITIEQLKQKISNEIQKATQAKYRTIHIFREAIKGDLNYGMVMNKESACEKYK